MCICNGSPSLDSDPPRKYHREVLRRQANGSAILTPSRFFSVGNRAKMPSEMLRLIQPRDARDTRVLDLDAGSSRCNRTELSRQRQRKISQKCAQRNGWNALVVRGTIEIFMEVLVLSAGVEKEVEEGDAIPLGTSRDALVVHAPSGWRERL